MKGKLWKKVMAGAAAALILAGSLSTSALAGSLDRTPDESEVLALTAQYDPDGYHILEDAVQRGDDFSSYIRCDVLGSIDTCIHEMHHGYVFDNGSVNRKTGMVDQTFYLGGGTDYSVPATKCFRTEVVTGSLPASLQTFRYDTYVSPGNITDANQSGVYGLLNEFSAYYWGCNSYLALYPYCETVCTDPSDWMSYISGYANGRDAYAEFYYWTLLYLEYARTNKPKVYKAIIRNRAYCNCFSYFESNFRAQLASYEQTLDALCMKYNGVPMAQSTIDGYLFLGWYGIGMDDNSAYLTLKPYIEDPAFDTVKQDLGILP